MVYLYFNPQGPRGPRHQYLSPLIDKFMISIHKALAGLDGYPYQLTHFLVISIHKALAGLDSETLLENASLYYFNPQGPRGPRLLSLKSVYFTVLFQSTRPSRASTLVPYDNKKKGVKISIHKALAGLDSKTIQQSLHIPLTFYALCPPLLISTSSIHSPSLFSRLFRCFSGANLPGISC